MPYKMCALPDFVPSQITLDSIEDMNNKVNMINLLEHLLTTVPLVLIFIRPKVSNPVLSVGTVAWNITSTDWKHFASALKSIGKIEIAVLNKIADAAQLDNTDSENKQFWKCVSDSIPLIKTM